MKKKIAVLVRERQDEAMRMAVGIILADDQVDVFVLDRKLSDSEQNRLNLETMLDFDMAVFTNSGDNPELSYLSNDDLASKLLEYDHILPY